MQGCKQGANSGEAVLGMLGFDLYLDQQCWMRVLSSRTVLDSSSQSAVGMGGSH